MDPSRIITMVINLILRKGLSKGIDYAARRGKDPAAMTPEEHAQAKSARALAKRAQQAANLARKLGR